uniref:Uncharacterized protein n=1 Tax=Physcomitrium patens TaxID=3218 RepID=A0A2K1L9L6_PHYPA|nr:hypothetical protein PHYPA_001146 [Physcomitrium patens]
MLYRRSNALGFYGRIFWPGFASVPVQGVTITAKQGKLSLYSIDFLGWRIASLLRNCIAVAVYNTPVAGHEQNRPCGRKIAGLMRTLLRDDSGDDLGTHTY